MADLLPMGDLAAALRAELTGTGDGAYVASALRIFQVALLVAHALRGLQVDGEWQDAAEHFLTFACQHLANAPVALNLIRHTMDG